MRYYRWVLAGVLLGTSVAAAQPPAQPAPAADPAKLDVVLREWEKAMQSVQAMAAALERVEDHKVLKNTDRYTGSAYFLKPNLAILALEKTDRKEHFERFICTGTHLYEYRPQQREIWVHDVPAPKQGNVADDSLLSFLFGMKADEARRRYDLKLSKEDQWYWYVEILPRYPADQADFAKARMVLNKEIPPTKDNPEPNKNAPPYMPRQLWFQQPNKDEITWSIPAIDLKPQLSRTHFVKPEAPKDWKLVQAPKAGEAKPRIYRPQQ